MANITKVGFILSQMLPSQLCFQMIDSSNRYLAEQDDVDICAFWINDGPKPLGPKFACMPLIESFAYNGHCVATSLHSLSRVINYPGPNRSKWIYYYMYDLDYLRVPAQMRQWEGFNQIINHPKVQVIARSQSHAEIIESVFRKPLAIVEDFNIEKFKAIVE